MSLNLSEPANVLYRVKRGLTSYVSYLAACDMNQAFSEYVLYEPILRILTSRGYAVSCEVECPGIQHPKRGDRKRLDFLATGHSIVFAIEVKWVRDAKPNINRDLEKLEALITAKPETLALLCVFGRRTHVEGLFLPPGKFKERGQAVIADLRKTRYACRIFQLLPATGVA